MGLLLLSAAWRLGAERQNSRGRECYDVLMADLTGLLTDTLNLAQYIRSRYNPVEEEHNAPGKRALRQFDKALRFRRRLSWTPAFLQGCCWTVGLRRSCWHLNPCLRSCWSVFRGRWSGFRARQVAATFRSTRVQLTLSADTTPDEFTSQNKIYAH